jgi:hypothetical protein
MTFMVRQAEAAMVRRRAGWRAALVAAIGAAAIAACSPQDEAPTVSDALFRTPLRADGPAAGYFTVMSGSADALTGVASDRAQAVEIHQIVMDGASSSMRRVDSVDIPAGLPVKFEPGGLHLMIFGMEALGPDEALPLRLSFRSGAVVTVPFAQKAGESSQR